MLCQRAFDICGNPAVSLCFSFLSMNRLLFSFFSTVPILQNLKQIVQRYYWPVQVLTRYGLPPLHISFLRPLSWQRFSRTSISFFHSLFTLDLMHHCYTSLFTDLICVFVCAPWRACIFTPRCNVLFPSSRWDAQFIFWFPGSISTLPWFRFFYLSI